MPRRCTTVPGYGMCCRAAMQNKLGAPMKVNMRACNGQPVVRCAQCDTITKKNGRPGFRFRLHKNEQCQIGPGGCPALAGGGQGLLGSVPGLASPVSEFLQ